jgi:hypothetical protein
MGRAWNVSDMRGRKKNLKGKDHLSVDGITMSRFGGVTIDGVWIGERIYWPLIHTTMNYK